MPGARSFLACLGVLLSQLCFVSGAESARAQRLENLLIDARTSIYKPCGSTDREGVFRLEPARTNEIRILRLTARGQGSASCCGPTEFGPPDGSDKLPGGEVGTHISGAYGVTGLQHDDKKMFLAGVFVDDDPCGDPPPPPQLDLRFTSSTSGLGSGAILDSLLNPATPFRLEPLLNQSFFIGDGRGMGTEQQQFVVPQGATALRLGFIDGCDLGSGRPGACPPRPSPPGFYGDNEGEFLVSLAVAFEAAGTCDPNGLYGVQGCGPDGRCVAGACVGCQSRHDCDTSSGETCFAGECVPRDRGFCDPDDPRYFELRDRVQRLCESVPLETCDRDPRGDTCADYARKRLEDMNCSQALRDFVDHCFRHPQAPGLGAGNSFQRLDIQDRVSAAGECQSAISKDCYVRGHAETVGGLSADCLTPVEALSQECFAGRQAACSIAKERADDLYRALNSLRHPEEPLCVDPQNYVVECRGGHKCNR
jgi:hypothetical protein